MVAERDTIEIHAWCMRCKERRLMLNPVAAEQRGYGDSIRIAHRGECVKCGAIVTTIGLGVQATPVPLPPERVIPAQTECPRELDGLRCGGMLKVDRDEVGYCYTCLTCGWQTEAPGPKRKPQPIRFVARYAGRVRKLADTVVPVTARRNAKNLYFVPRCPWCNQEMRATSLSGKRHNKQETRYMCGEGHRISLIDEEMLVWR